MGTIDEAPPVPQLWGVLNVTPDSFSDGGDYLDPGLAIARARQMVEDGADVIDVGAESTRPGASRIDADTEIRRLEPVVRALLVEGITVSVDTMRAATAARALQWGVPIINDVSGGQAEPDILNVVADSDAHYVLMHWRGHSEHMDSLAHYTDVVAEVTGELQQQIDRALAAGIDATRITIDPGLGFAKTPDHNWAIIQRIEHFSALGYPLLVGASRKRFLGTLLREDHNPTDRDGVSVALSVALAGREVSALRVHEPRIHRDALEVWRKSQPGGDQ